MAAALRKEPDLKVELIDGTRGELTVLVDGREVASKGDSLPNINEVVAAVKGTAPVGTGA